MSDEKLAAWFHREFHPCMHPNNSANRCDAWAEQFARTSGWVSPEEAAAREAAAHREALLEAEERVSKAEDELRRVKAASLYADGHMQVIVDMDRRYDRLRAHADQTEQELDKARARVEEYAAIKAHLAASIRSAEKAEAKITRVEALADCPPGDCEGHPCIWPEDIRAALAEPERDEEGGMLGGHPNFKYRDATVPVDGEQPGPNDEESGR